MSNQIVRLSIPPPPLFDLDQCLYFLDRGYDECLYQLEHNAVSRVIKVDDQLIPFTIRTGDKGNILVELPLHLNNHQEAILNYTNEWLDLKRNIDGFYRLLSDHKELQTLTKQFRGLRLIGIPDLFEALCWSIIGQQINLAFAYKLKRRLVESYGTSFDWQGKTLWHFPSPEALVSLDEDHLKGQQFSRGKIKYLRNVALAFTENGLSRSILEVLPDFESRQTELMKIKGIGEWSANYALMKTLHQPEAIPFGDTGLTQALFNHGIIQDRKDRPAIEAFFKKVQGWEAYTVFYLWRSLSG